ncbi:RDD family protein [Alkalicoccobacillus gibsonii]|uniref:RDD family protein n=1 Tax=Alkalicoccobacillus gibsonii TaxID=79881 RepID=UPI003F7CA9AA
MMNQHASTPLSRSRRARLKKNQEPIQTDELHLESQQPQANESTVIQKEEATVQYAGFWVRFWAFLLDQVVLLSLNSILINSWFTFLGEGVRSIGPFATLTFVHAITFFIYYALMTKLIGKTVGKMVLGIKVVSDNGQPLSWKQMIFREGIGRLFYHLQIFTLPIFLILYLFVAFVPTKRGLHDLVADTSVIHDKK